MNTTPQHGQVVTFSKVPAGSYCTPGVAYRVDRKGNKGAYRFENVARGSATYDQPWAVKSASVRSTAVASGFSSSVKNVAR